METTTPNESKRPPITGVLGLENLVIEEEILEMSSDLRWINVPSPTRWVGVFHGEMRPADRLDSIGPTVKFTRYGLSAPEVMKKMIDAAREQGWVFADG